MPTTITSAGVTFNDTTTLTSANGVPSALKLTTARTINGVSFDGTGNITIPATSISGANVAKAWVNFNGTLATPITPRASYNVSSVTKNAASVYTVNFASALADANYAITGSLSVLNQGTGSTSDTNASVYNGSFAVSNDTVPTTTSCKVVASGGYYSGNGYENPRICVAIFGN